MRGIAAWFARNTVASNLLMLTLLAGGLFAATTIKVELFPEFSLEMVSVRVVYPGSAPEEVEQSICIPIEEEVHSIEGVKRVTSSASEGVGVVMIEVKPGEDPRRVLDDVKTRVDALDTFPAEADKPVIEEIMMRRQVISLAIYGDVEEVTLKGIAEGVRDRVNSLPGISQVELSNTRPYEISIEISEHALRRYRLTFDEVAAAVRSSSIDLSGGSLKTEGGEILLRTAGQAYTGADFERVVVRTQPDGSRIFLSDVAQVVDGFEDTDQKARFNGRPVATVQVYRVGDESALDISRVVHEYIEETRLSLPAGVSIEPWQDNAVWLQDRLDLLIKNGSQGLLLVFLVLALFLHFRLSFWVTLGIPISFAGALWVMPMFDQSLNMLSLFAFILVLGIVVDDAIVVGENIFKEQEHGHPGVKGAVRGVQGVSVPVIFAVLTTIFAFLPMTVLPGVLGKFFAVIPMTVIPALAFSLVESQWILPAHLSHTSPTLDAIGRMRPFIWWTRFRMIFSEGLLKVRDRLFHPLLELALRWRYVTLATAVSVVLLTAGLAASGLLKFVFFPNIEGDIVVATVTMPQGTSARATGVTVAKIEAAADALLEELNGSHTEGGQSVVRNFMASVGEQPYATMQQQNGGAAAGIIGAQYGEVVIELIPSEQRDITSLEIANRWRELCGPLPGAVELAFTAAIMSAGKPINIEFAGSDIAELRLAASELRARIESYDGTFNVMDSFRGGKQELVLDIRPAAETLGLSRADLARQVRQGFYGEEAQRIQRGRDDLKVMVRYPKADRDSLYSLESMRVRTPQGDEVPFSTVASVHAQRGYATIQRTDRKRTVSVTADVNLEQANPSEITAALEQDVLPDLIARHPSVSYSLEGQSNDQAETIAVMARTFALVIFATFGLMAIPFRSYLQPLIIMSAIPFGMVGAFLGHMLLGIDLSMLSVMGLAALAGVVVNDSLVLVDFVNRMRAEGAALVDAAREASVARFRPIILTSLTTFVGLTPLILEKNVQAQFLVPMAVSLAFGVLFSTMISLVLVPTFYLILEDVKHGFAWLYGSPVAVEDKVVPAAAHVDGA